MAKARPKKAKKSKSGLPPAEAIHLSDNQGHHAVGIGNLRVIIVKDTYSWFAQGLEIDYAVQGSSEDDAKKQFEDGLTATIQQHLKAYGNIARLLKVAPPEVWKDMLFDPSAKYNEYFSVKEHEITHEAFPFEGIQFLVAAQQTCG